MKILFFVVLMCATIFSFSTERVDASSLPREFNGRCLLKVDGNILINGSCPISMYDNGDFYIGSSTEPLGFFAKVELASKNEGNALWNEERGANHAHSYLGAVIRKGACWINERTEICAWRD